MKEFYDDLIKELSQYYDGFVALLPKIGVSLIIVAIIWLLNRLMVRNLRKRLEKRLQDRVLARFLSRLVRGVVIFLGCALILKTLGLGDIAIGLFSSAGVVAIVLGFAFKDIGENLIAGVLLAFDRPFKTGDLISVASERGRVVGMNIRQTQLKTIDGRDIFIPNASIVKGNLTNFTLDNHLRFENMIGIEYGADIPKALELIKEALLKIEGVVPEKGVNAFVSGYGASSYEVTYTFWIDLFSTDTSRTNLRSRAFHQIWEVLNEAGFGLPGDIMELKNADSKGIKVVS